MRPARSSVAPDLNLIANRDLKPADIPKTIRGWQDFALTFDGYKAHSGFNACARIANKRAPRTLTDYRTCLFFEQRRWRHFDCGPGEWEPERDDVRYIKFLMAGIRDKVRKGEVD